MTKLIIDAIVALEQRSAKAIKSGDLMSYGTFQFAIRELQALIA